MDYVMNAVGQYGQSSIASQAPVKFLYTEVWGNHPGYQNLKEVIEQNWEFGNNQLNTVLAAYMNYSFSNAPGTFNAPGILLTDAVIFASGGSHLERGENLVIMKGSKQSNEAWTFMKWMTRKEAQLVMSRIGLIPTNLEAVKTMTVKRDTYIYPYVKALDYTFLRPPTKNWSKIDEVYTFYLKKIFTGELSVKDGLDRAAAEIDKLLVGSETIH